MEIINLKCTGCGAPISDIKSSDAVLTCPYCGSMLFVKGCIVQDVQTSPEAPKTEPVEQLRVPLCCVAKELSDHEALKAVVNGMSNVLDENSGSDTIIPIINRILNGKKEAATADSFPNDLEKVQKLLKNVLVDGERLIFYKTAAFFGFNKLKTGMFITTERVGYIDGKHVYEVAYSCLDSLLIEIAFDSTTYWYPNGNEKIFLSPLAVTKEEFGAIIAYIVLRSYEKSDRQKSVVLSMK